MEICHGILTLFTIATQHFDQYICSLISVTIRSVIFFCEFEAKALKSEDILEC